MESSTHQYLFTENMVGHKLGEFIQHESGKDMEENLLKGKSKKRIADIA